MNSLNKLADYLDLSYFEAKELKGLEVLKPNPDSREYNFDENRVSYIRYLRETGKKFAEVETKELLSLELERAHNLHVHTELMKRKILTFDKEMVRVDELQKILSKVGSEIAAILGAIPQKISKRVQKLSMFEMQIIETEIALAQNLASNVRFYEEND